MNTLTTISTNNTWEQRFGYARINAIGHSVFIGGTVAVNPDGSPPTGSDIDAGKQTARCFEIIESALAQLNLDRTAIMRSRIFVTDITQAHAVGDAHKAFFHPHTPCLTQVEVSALIAPEYIVEIECDAYRQDT